MPILYMLGKGGISVLQTSIFACEGGRGHNSLNCQ